MKCCDARELMSLYIDNMLSKTEKQNFEAHLKECSDCEHELKILETVVNDTKQLNTEKELPRDFHSRLMNRLEKEENRRKVYTFKPWYSAVAAAFVIFLIFGVIGISQLNQYNKSVEDQSNYEKSAPKMEMKQDATTSDTADNTAAMPEMPMEEPAKAEQKDMDRVTEGKPVTMKADMPQEDTSYEVANETREETAEDTEYFEAEKDDGAKLASEDIVQDVTISDKDSVAIEFDENTKIGYTMENSGETKSDTKEIEAGEDVYGSRSGTEMNTTAETADDTQDKEDAMNIYVIVAIIGAIVIIVIMVSRILLKRKKRK